MVPRGTTYNNTFYKQKSSKIHGLMTVYIDEIENGRERERKRKGHKEIEVGTQRKITIEKETRRKEKDSGVKFYFSAVC